MDFIILHGSTYVDMSIWLASNLVQQQPGVLGRGNRLSKIQGIEGLACFPETEIAASPAGNAVLDSVDQVLYPETTTHKQLTQRHCG